MDTLKAVFIDRDGVINVDRPDCVHNADEFILIDGSLEALARVKKDLAKPCVLITNQSCIGRGWVPAATVESLHRGLRVEVEALGGQLNAIYICPHAPNAGCDCRKPKPGMLLKALSDHGWRANEVVFIGDSFTDFQAARAVGIKFLLVLTGKGLKTRTRLSECDDEPMAQCENLAAALDWLSERF